MTWMIATICCAGSMIATTIGTEVLRSIVHRRRARVDGLGGTQDVAMWGTLAACVLMVMTVVCATIWLSA